MRIYVVSKAKLMLDDWKYLIRQKRSFFLLDFCLPWKTFHKKNIYTVTCNIFSRWLGKVFLLNAISSCFYFFRFYFCTCNHFYRCIREKYSTYSNSSICHDFYDGHFIYISSCCHYCCCCCFRFQHANDFLLLLFFAIQNICLASFAKLIFLHTHR